MRTKSQSSWWEPVFSEKHEDAVTGVDRRRLLGSTRFIPSKIELTIQQVEVLVAGDRLGEVLVDPQVESGIQSGGAVAVVVRPRTSASIRLHGTRRTRGTSLWREGCRWAMKVTFRGTPVLGEEGVEGGEAAQDVLREVVPGRTRIDQVFAGARSSTSRLGLCDPPASRTPAPSRSASMPSG